MFLVQLLDKFGIFLTFIPGIIFVEEKILQVNVVCGLCLC